jgi:hypothetical protein
VLIRPVQRDIIPQDLNAGAPDPSTWPRPSAYFPANGCDPRTFFSPQRMIINIDVCGAWPVPVFNTTGCSGSCTALVGTASNYNNAYWEIAYVKTFTAQGNVSTTASGGASGSGSATASAGTGTHSVTAAVPTSGGARLAVVSWMATALFVFAGLAAFA